MADATATDTTPDAAHDAGTGDHHPSAREYVQIAGALFVLTALEFSTYFIEFGPLHIPLLLILMAIKFALVAGFFMHLKFDTTVYRRFMVTGLVGALALYALAMLALLEFPAGTGLG